MDEKKQYEPLFPVDMDYLNAKYQRFQQTLTAIDYELDNGLKDEGPNPAPAPRGMRPITPLLRLKRMEYLEKTRPLRVEAFKRGVQNQIDGFDEKEQRTLNDRFDFETSRNGFKDYSKFDLSAVKDVSKQDKISFDYMAAEYFNKYQMPDKAVAVEKENIDVWSDRYQKVLDFYTVHAGQDIEIPIIDREPTKE